MNFRVVCSVSANFNRKSVICLTLVAVTFMKIHLQCW